MPFTEQLNQSIKFTAFFTASGLGKTGMVNAGTISIDVFNPAGTQVITADPVVEVGDGWYSYTFPTTTTAGEYLAVFKSTDVTCDQRHISDAWSVGRNWVTNVDQAVSSRSTLSAAGVWGYSTRNLTDFGLILSTPVTTPTVNPTGGGSVGGSLQAGTYYLKYTFINTAGETPASPESLQFTVSTGNIPTVTLPALPSGATGTNLYITAASGASGTETLYATGIVTTTYNLSAATTTSQPQPPTVNTTNALATAIWLATTRSLTNFNFNVTVGTNNDKSGYSLASTGLDSIAVTDPGGMSSINTFPKMLVSLWRYFFRKTTATATQLKTFKDDDTTVNVTMPLSNDGTTQTKGTGA